MMLLETFEVIPKYVKTIQLFYIENRPVKSKFNVANKRDLNWRENMNKILTKKRHLRKRKFPGCVKPNRRVIVKKTLKTMLN